VWGVGIERPGLIAAMVRCGLIGWAGREHGDCVADWDGVRGALLGR